MKVEDIFLHRIRFKQPCHGLPKGTVGMVYQVTQKPSGEVYFAAVCFPPVQVCEVDLAVKDTQTREYESLPVFVRDFNFLGFEERIEVLEGDDYTSTLWNQSIFEWNMRHAPCAGRIVHDKDIFFCLVCGAKGKHYKHVRTENAPDNLSGIVMLVELTDEE